MGRGLFEGCGASFWSVSLSPSLPPSLPPSLRPSLPPSLCASLSLSLPQRAYGVVEGAFIAVVDAWRLIAVSML